MLQNWALTGWPFPAASLLIAQGESPKYIQHQLGHSSIQVTMDRYGHLMPETNLEAGERLDRAVFGAG